MKLSKYLMLGTLSCYALTGCIGSDSSSSTVVGGEAYIPFVETGGTIAGTHESLLKTDGTQAGTVLVYDPSVTDNQSVYINSLTSLGNFIYFEKTIDESSIFNLSSTKTYNQLDITTSNTPTILSSYSNQLFSNIGSIKVGNKVFEYYLEFVTTTPFHSEIVLKEYDSLGVVTDHTTTFSSYQMQSVAIPIVIGTDIYFAADAMTSGFIKFDTTTGAATHIAITGEQTVAFSYNGTTLYAYTYYGNQTTENLYSYDTLTGTLNPTPLQSGIVMETKNYNIPENNGYLISSDQTNLIAFNTNSATSTPLGSCINSQLLYNDSTDAYIACYQTTDTNIIKVDLSTTTPTATTYGTAYLVDADEHAWVNSELYFFGQDTSYSNRGLWFINPTTDLPESIVFSNTTDEIGSLHHLTELNGELIFSARNNTLGENHLYNFNPTSNVLTELY
jgi:hypothetical protein